MRTTLDIDDAVLHAAKELARRQGRTAGEVISDLARHALMNPGESRPGEVREPPASNGFRPFPAGDALVTNDLVDRLRDETGV